MDLRSKKNENHCDCKEKKQIRAYCKKCKLYLCGDCLVTAHIEHESEIEDLPEKCTRFLADIQKLSRAASLMADRRQVHIKDESIETIVGEIKGKIVKAKEDLQKDIAKSTEMSAGYLAQCPLVQEFIRKKTDFEGKLNDPLAKLKAELGQLCKDLLLAISENKYETADRIVSKEAYQKYEEEIKGHTEASVHELNFIQELRKLKQTTVNYSYDPMAILGMIKVCTHVKKPNRIIQFDRERNELNIFNFDTERLTTTKLNAGFILPFRFVSTDACNNVYISGGDNDHGQYLRSLYLYDELRGSLIPMAPMLLGRSRHALAAIESNSSLYAIGGESSEGVLRSCEIYEIKENEWKPAPKLNEARCGLSVCVFQGKIIYAVGGWNQEYLGSMEYLDVGQDKPWEMLKLSKSNHIRPVQTPGLAEIGEKTLLIYGGYKENEEITDECWTLDIKAGKLSKSKGMVDKEAFISSEAKSFGGKLYSFGYTKGGIHMYDPAKDEWTFMEQDKIPH